VLIVIFPILTKRPLRFKSRSACNPDLIPGRRTHNYDHAGSESVAIVRKYLWRTIASWGTEFISRWKGGAILDFGQAPVRPFGILLYYRDIAPGSRNAELRGRGRISASCGLKFDVNSLGIEFDTFAMSGSVVSCE